MPACLEAASTIMAGAYFVRDKLSGVDGTFLSIERMVSVGEPTAMSGGICALIWPDDGAISGIGRVSSVRREPPRIVGSVEPLEVVPSEARLFPVIETSPLGANEYCWLARFT